jgi:ATP adenylyltransferase
MQKLSRTLLGCPFCEMPPERIVTENLLAYVIHDAFPVTPWHTLLIPKRHVTTYFDLGQAEVNACTRLLHVAKARMEAMDPSIQGFNIGVNDGEVAGQTILHCHLHVIPRRAEDVENPRGGIRHIIPGKGYY